MPNHDYGIDYTKQKAVSYSQYSIFKQCKHRWYLQYIKKHKMFEVNMNLTFGTSLHEVVQSYLEKMYSESGKAADSMDLIELFKDRMLENYKLALKDNKGVHFSNKEEFDEFLIDGIQILDHIKKKRSQYFSLKNEELIGIEIPLNQPILDNAPDIRLIGSIDLVFRNKNTGTYRVIDIKTSTSGWKDKDKKDQTKLNQLILYKVFYSKVLGVNPEMINVEFFIVRRKIYEEADFPISRVQEFSPAQGKIKMKQAVNDLSEFVQEAFTQDAKYIDKLYEKSPDNCKYCPFKDKLELCDRKK